MFKKTVGIFLSIVMLTGVFSGCGGSENADVETVQNETPVQIESTVAEVESETAGNDELVEINWYVDLPYWTWAGQGFGEDLTSQMIMDATGVKINFIVPASDDSEQLSAMIASDSLPDIITVEGWFNDNTRMLTYQMATEGYIWSINDLMDQYCPEMKDNIRQDVFDWYAEADGKTYLLPNFAYSKDDLSEGEKLVPNGCITIRKDLYEAIGSPDMSTPEGFLDACLKVKNEIKQYDGQDIIPIQMYEGVGNSMLWLSQYFATPYEDEDGNYLYDFTQENYKEALQFLNKAYNMGLISDANFSDTRDLVNEKIASGRVFCQITAPQDFVTPMQSLYDLDSNAVYIPVVLRNSKGEDPVLQDIRGFGWLVSCVSKSTENPEAVARLINWLLSDEGQIATTFGKEGVTYTMQDDGKIAYTEEYEKALAAGDTKKYALSAMNLLANYAFTRHYEPVATDPKILATVDTYVKQPMAQYAYDYSAQGLKLDPADPRKEEMSQLSVKISDFRTQTIAELITASENSFDSQYQQAVETLNSMGLAELVNYNNDGFQNAKKALGIERSWPPYIE